MESNVQGETEGIESATNGVSSDPTPVGHPTKELELEPASQTTAAEDERKYPQGTKFYVIFVSACLVLILAEMDFSIVAVAVPSITNTYHTVADIGWYSSAFRLSMCSFQFLFGKLYKLFSFKKIFMGCVGIFLLASIVCSFAPTSLSFVIGRAIAGLASGGIVAGIFTLLVYCLPLRKRPLYTSFAGAIEGVSIIGAPVIGGFLVEVDWRWCFIINIPLSVIALVLLAIFLEDFKPSARQSWRQCVKELDLLGNLVLIPSLTCLFMALGWAGTRYEWSSPTIIALFCVFFFLLIVFAIDQWAKQDAATLPPRILKNRSILSGFLFSLCCSSTLNVVEYYLPIWFQAVREYSPSTSGLLMIPGVVGYMVAFLLQGSGVNVIGYYVPFVSLKDKGISPFHDAIFVSLRHELTLYPSLWADACGLDLDASLRRTHDDSYGRHEHRESPCSFCILRLWIRHRFPITASCCPTQSARERCKHGSRNYSVRPKFWPIHIHCSRPNNLH